MTLMLNHWKLGVMQGRLLPKYKGRYQAHPKGYWADEFSIAASLGLDLIEFILDFEGAEENPLLAPGGIDKILDVSNRNNVGIRSICADYFMEAPLHRGSHRHEAADTLNRLLDQASRIGVTDIVIPCVDHSRIEGPEHEDALVSALSSAIPRAEKLGINLSLETDLDPLRFSGLLERLPSPRITVNYDIGNSASLGFEPHEEWASYGHRISDVHVKDRTMSGGSTELGTGDADIPLVFKLMQEYDYSGPVIMQAFRDDEGLSIFKRQLIWLRLAVAQNLP